MFALSPLAGRRSALALACALALSLTGAPTATAQNRPSEPVTLNFVGAEIEAVARTMATITGRSVVVDPRVRGTINLSTDRPVAPAAALNQFAAALRLQGFALVDTGGLYKIVPEADAKLQGNVVSAGAVSALPSSNTVVTQIFRLNHENANNLVPVLRPLIPPNNTINVNPGNNSLVITDYAENLQRIGRIVAALDIPGASDIEIIPLQHAVAADIVPLIQRLIDPTATGGAAGGAGAGDASFRTTIVAEPRSNALVLRAANPARLALVKSLVVRLDQPSATVASGNIHVVYLKNADAASLATTLRAAIAAGESGGGGSLGGSGSSNANGGALSRASTSAINLSGGNTGGGMGSAASTPVAASAQPSTGGMIQADPATNSLIITAPEPLYRQLRAVIDQLDSRRAQVYVESLIAEVNDDKAAEFGIQWQGASGSSGDRVIGLLGTNFGDSSRNIFSLAQGETAPAAGLNIGLARRTNGVYVLGFLARFLQENGAGNILSTPNLLTLDNEEAKIVIGQNVPFVTGQFTNTGGGNNGSVNPFQTIERKDVGITLRVKPQISENGTIKLTIYQEVSSVAPASVNSSTGLITNLRSIESTVLVNDGAIVVLGGLLQDEYAQNQDKVPGLGDVPVLGGLFRSETRSRRKTNLMVFLRPVVLRDERDTANLALDRYEQMRAIQRELQPTPSSVLKINETPVLGPQALPYVRQAPRPTPLGAPEGSPNTVPAATPPAAPAPAPAPAPAQ
ncbi:MULTISPECIES: type II secretion system secretin GspD [Hydrogenophaga]|uniref:General secretion pathway protein D n=1 Tax=Hydrogenophaga intermedia TaxID=65786 RepID=A0A1L1PAY4_HYDIT|nr:MULTISPECIES: type II secretion system secretin GspD [Hydrogenophaga]AOS77831.1 type II secretion system protein GspD [Hydrogenophaga sp. PBC]TMU75985.1 type II secretion system protein GspD [Hydrogenophaga intermedia]CDN85934.1 General secretion pathway protein D [Hydrogenophaga intermedia]